MKKSRRTVESEDGFNEYAIPRAGELQRFVAGAVLAGIAGAAIYTAGAYALSAAAPLAARFMAGPGQQVMNIAQSEAGAINPATQPEMTSLYRAVSPAEYNELLQTGTFKSGINSLEGKFFAETADHAAEWGQKLQGNDNFRVIRIQIPTNVADTLMRWGRLDGIGPARYADLDALNGAHPTISAVK